MNSNKSTIAIIGVILTAIGIISPIVYSEFKKHSEIEIKKVESITVISKPSEIKGLEISYNNQKINELKKISLRITNNSNLSIIKTDFVNPLKINFSKDANIISFNIEDSHPINLFPYLRQDTSSNSLILEFDLLNPNDNLLLGVLYSGNLSSIEVLARIKGIEDVVYRDENKKNDVVPVTIVFIVIILSSLLLILVNREKKGSFASLKYIDEKSLINTKKDKLLNEISALLFHLPKSVFISFSQKIEQVCIDDENIEEDRLEEIINLLTTQLKANLSLNTKAYIVINILRFIGIIYLIIWIITVGNILYK